MITLDDTCECYLCSTIVSRYTKKCIPIAQEDPENRDSIVTAPVCDKCYAKYESEV